MGRSSFVTIAAALLLACNGDPAAADDGEASGLDRAPRDDSDSDSDGDGDGGSDPDPGDEAEAGADTDRLQEECDPTDDGGCENPGMAEDPDPPAEPPPPGAGATVFVAIPDTQIYTHQYPGLFTTQTKWIAENADRLNIRFVFHLGDIVNDDTIGEWSVAREAMALLDDVVPYPVVPGNHDYPHWPDNSMTRGTSLSSWFTYDEASARPDFGGAYQVGRTENTYHLFSAGGHDWIALALEWGPRDEVVAWADEIMAEHDDRLGILVTHAYLNHNDRRYDHTDPVHPQHYNPHNYDLAGTVNDGEELWQKLVRRHRFVMTLSGHVLGDGAGYLATRTDVGNVCHQMLSNYQMRAMGGEGYLRILELRPDGRTVAVRTFSPVLGSYFARADQEFSFELDIDA